MKIEGSSEIPVARQKVWDAFLDPTVLEKALPGCEKLEAVGPGEYKATLKVGVGPIKGTFEGKVRLFDLEPPNKYRMAIEGTGGPGFVRGDAGMELSISSLRADSLSDKLVASLARGGHLAYTSDAAAAVAAVARGGAQAAVLMRPITLSEIETVVHSGDRLPPRSVSFYPEMFAGLFGVSLEDPVY